MLERGELSRVTANAELADRLMATARQHLASVRESSPCPRRPLVACVMGATMLRLAPFLAPRHVAEGSKRALTSDVFTFRVDLGKRGWLEGLPTG